MDPLNSSILIIEDDPKLLKAARRLLVRNHFTVFQASTGQEGLQKAREHQPDLVLSDIKLPDTNGYLICEKLKADRSLEDTYVILISGIKISSSDQARGIELGAEGYISRPISNRELLARIQAFARLQHTEKELRQTKQELEAKNQDLQRSNQDLQRFAYSISHDLQEPLRMVTSFLDLLQKRYQEKLDSAAQDYIHFAVDGAERMKAMIQGLLSYSRVETQDTSLSKVSSEEVLQQALDHFRLQIGETNAVVTHKNLPEVHADENQLLSVFQNLIGNALKYHGEAPPVIHVTAEKDQKHHCWRFSVQDHGIGIPEKDHDRVFEIFSRLHTREEYQGIGMGLAITRRIIRRHGGEIWIDSPDQEGTTVRFTIPIRKTSE
jgi:light-regulated signal transduction histidine kinase (bacteriophytochrome)